jgi:hypothetical protein
MVRTVLSLTALLVISAMLVAADQKNAQKSATADSSVVVVDPMDLRQPVPNPERELSEKYDGKQVRFTGRLHGMNTDKKTKATSYQLQKDVKSAATDAKAKGKKDAKAKADVVTVTVYLQKDDQRLHDSKSKINLTVEGKAEISTSDGSMIIRNARVTDFEKR